MKTASVLIVDDEKNVRLTLVQALETLGLDCDTAINGEEALVKLAQRPFGLILLDLKMPGMDGIEVLRRLRHARPDIRVLIITAHGTIDSAVEAMKLGAVDFIQKPFAPKEIRALVTKVLDRDTLQAARAEGYHSHVELAKKAIAERQFEAAQEHIRQAIAADSTKPEAFNLLGVLCEINDDKLEAHKNYRAALALDPTYRPADQNLRRATGVTLREDIDLGDAPEPPEGRE